MITLEKVCFAYEHEVALRYVNLHIEKGESLVIQGPNGCGKSTLIKLLNGIIFPSEGHYLYKGHEITEKALKDRQFAKWFHQQMGYVFRTRIHSCFAEAWKRKLRLDRFRWGFRRQKSGREQRIVFVCLELKSLEKDHRII